MDFRSDGDQPTLKHSDLRDLEKQMTETLGPKAALILLDAAERTLVAQAIEQGWMPNLKAFRERGAWAVLQSEAADINASVWPSFLTGKPPGDHGVWNFIAWDPERMDHSDCDPASQNYEPWWRALSDQGHRCMAMDVPRAFPPDRPFDGIELGAWAGHYKFTRPFSHPPEVVEQVTQRFGPELLGSEPGGGITPGILRSEFDRTTHAAQKQADMACWALDTYPCDLFVLALSCTHRAGHMFWSEKGLADAAGEKPEDIEKIRSMRREVYIAADRAFGQMLEKLEAMGTPVVMAAALHGMGDNPSPAIVLPEMLDRVLNDRYDDGTSGESEDLGMVKRLRNAVPLSWRTAVKDRLPMRVQFWLTRYWRRQQVDWSRTRAVALLDDLQGFIRINLRGREREGIVEPGAEYDALCKEIIQGLMTFTHEDTGEAMVEEVFRSDERYAGGEYLHEFPDLVVKWGPRPIVECGAFVSPKYGRIVWPAPGRVPDGRSGHHLSDGWLAAVGQGVKPGAVWEGLHAFDLVPTLHKLAGAPVPEGMAGSPIIQLLDAVPGAASSQDAAVS